MLQIDNKFNMGDKVYSMHQVAMEIKCDLCDGEGYIEYKEKRLRCPQCKGQCILTNKKHKCWEVIPKELTVRIIKASINSVGEVSIRYYVSNFRRAEENVFATIEEAQAKCDMLNHTIKSNNS